MINLMYFAASCGIITLGVYWIIAGFNDWK